MTMKQVSSKDEYPEKGRRMTINVPLTCQNIRRLCAEHGTPPLYLQKQLGLSASTAYKWLDGHNLPSLDNLYTLSHLWGVPINDILVPYPPPGEDYDPHYADRL